MQRLGWLLFVLLAAACGAVVEPQEPRTEDGTPLLISFESVTLDEARTTVRLDFIGGRAFDPADRCTTDYAASAKVVDDVLEVGIIELVHPLLLNAGPDGVQVACDAAGHQRTAFVALAEPFDGTTVRDRAGYVHFVRAPEGLVNAPKLPAGWGLRFERSLEESRTGRWQRAWSPLDDLPEAPSRGRVDLIQAFDGPVGVRGGEDTQQLAVNGAPALLYISREAGELVLTWFVEGDGLALVVNEQDFTVPELLELARSVEPAPGP